MVTITDSPDSALRVGYEGKISVECVFTDLAEESVEQIRFLEGD